MNDLDPYLYPGHSEPTTLVGKLHQADDLLWGHIMATGSLEEQIKLCDIVISYAIWCFASVVHNTAEYRTLIATTMQTRQAELHEQHSQ